MFKRENEVPGSVLLLSLAQSSLLSAFSALAGVSTRLAVPPDSPTLNDCLPQAPEMKGIMEGKSHLIYFFLENSVKKLSKKNFTVCSQHSVYEFSSFSLVSRESVSIGFCLVTTVAKYLLLLI